MSEKLKGLLASGDSPIVGPNAAGELRAWIAEAEAARPTPATEEQIENAIAMLALATKEKAGTTRADARARLELFSMALSDVAGTDLTRGLNQLVRTIKFMPTPSEVRAAALSFAARREYAISRARHLVWKHETQWAPPVAEIVPPEELAGLLADTKEIIAQGIAAEPKGA